jgi:primary-amine oxidase
MKSSRSRYLPLLIFPMLGSLVGSCASTPRSESSKAPANFAHPLDPLSETELAQAIQIAKGHPEFPDRGLFALIDLQEPPKSDVIAFVPGNPIRRNAKVVIMDPKNNRTFELITDFSKVVSWKEIKNIQPPILPSEYERYTKIVKSDVRFVEAMKKRGITNLDDVIIEGWAPGPFLPKAYSSARLMRGVCYLTAKNGSNYYGQPIEGVIPTVNMNTGQLVDLLDTGTIPLPGASQQFDVKSLGLQRSDIRPLITQQPDGPSFEVHGNEVRWQKWRFRFSIHPRDGIVLHQVSYEDTQKPTGAINPRSILYRASLSETLVPYGDPDPVWSWRSAFDEGEYGFGKLSVSVKKDVPAHARLFDVNIADDMGNILKLKDRIGLYERDGGVLWRHSADRDEEVRRARELVLLTASTIGNYDYLFSWIFKQDGTIEVDVGASGIMLPKGVRADLSMHEEHSSGHRVSSQIVAPHHQHFFNYRLDFDIDGVKNSAAELNTFAVPPGKANPYLNAMRMEEKVLRSESEGKRDLNPAQARKWRVFNPSITNSLGTSPGYILVPGENGSPYVWPQSEARKRGGFIDHAIWLTRFHENEEYAAGEFPNQARAGEGLPLWSSNREPLVNEDVVLWYTIGLTHIPRPEEWPVMPVAHLGFKLIPAAFFTQNPALDVPPANP